MVVFFDGLIGNSFDLADDQEIHDHIPKSDDESDIGFGKSEESTSKIENK